MAQERELQEILRKHANAMGGLRNWNKVESIRTTGKIERNDQIVDFCIIKKHPNQIRATITLPIPGQDDEKLQVIRAYDGKEAWTATRLTGGQTINHQRLTGTDATEVAEEAIILPRLIHLWRNRAQLALVDSESTKGKNAYVVSAIPDDQPERRYEFHICNQTFTTIEVISYLGDTLTSKVVLSQLTEVSGIQIFKKHEMTSPISGKTRMQIQEVTVGVGIYEEYFEGCTDIFKITKTAHKRIP